MPKRTVSLITTLYNEADSIRAFIQSVIDQSREPDEIIVCDAGSTDGTVRIVREYIEEGFPARLIIEKGANRSRGRNRAIEEAKGEIIAGIDGGCAAARDWLSRLVAPFESDDPPDVVAGYYEPDTDTALEDAIAVATVPDASEVDPETFLPSGRSVAFRRDAWERVGGYPEYVDYAEDTDFGLRLKAAGFRFQFVPEAFVRWRMQADLWSVFRQFFRYSRSDGELGHWFLHYRKAYLGVLLMVALFLMSLSGSKAAPFLFVGLLIAYWARYTARALRRGADWYASLIAPGVSATVDVAHLIGYSLGYLRHRPRPRRLPTGRPLRVAQVTYTYRPIAGGADVYAAQLADLITAAGHEHCVYQRLADTNAEDARFIRNPWRGMPLEFWTQALALFRHRKELLSHDVIICHYPHYLLAIDLMSFFARRPLRIGVSHGVFWDDAPGSPKSFVKAWLTKLAFRRAHLYVANDSHFLRAMGLQLEPRQGMYARISPGVWFIPNGVDPGKFKPTDPVPEIRDRNAILVPRHLFRNRGIHLAIEAFAQFHPFRPETTLFLVGGGGQAEYVESLRREVEARGLKKSVIFYGSVPHAKLSAIYSSAQLTLIPSLCGEGTSLSALESMACGTATICTYVAGLRDLPGPHCLPIVSSLVEVMETVYRGRSGVGEEQQEIAVAVYSIDRWRESWREALKGVGVRTTGKVGLLGGGLT
ncbi:MAG TPA: glycosyltransferase [Armatimonadota bacterium]|nr:glycosyltransferase [Armatimonadota bacterium]